MKVSVVSPKQSDKNISEAVKVSQQSLNNPTINKTADNVVKSENNLLKDEKFIEKQTSEKGENLEKMPPVEVKED